MKPVEICPPIEAWITRSLVWGFKNFQKSVTIELMSDQVSVQSIQAQRVAPLNENKGEILVTLGNHFTTDALKTDLKQRIKGSIKDAIVLGSGNLLFKFDCHSSERNDFSSTATDFFRYKRDESQILFEAIVAAREVFEILGIHPNYLRHLKLQENTLVADASDGGTWIGLEKFLLGRLGFPTII